MFSKITHKGSNNYLIQCVFIKIFYILRNVFFIENFRFIPCLLYFPLLQRSNQFIKIFDF